MTEQRQGPRPTNQDCPTISGEELIELMKAVHGKNAPFRFRAGGFSMNPFIKDGDIITISPQGQTPAGRGDIVAFLHPVTGKLLVHRIIGNDGSFMRLRGDNATIEDGLVPLPDILGKVIRVERDGEDVCLGLGIEKHIISKLSERSLLSGLLQRIYNASRFFRPAGREKR
jgi:hypothetical protein